METEKSSDKLIEAVGEKNAEFLINIMNRTSGRMNNNTSFAPKGGMCSGCNKQMEDCSDLSFHSMYVIKFDSDDNTAYVKCTEHDPLPKEIVQYAK
jgi:hypothetical protein